MARRQLISLKLQILLTIFHLDRPQTGNLSPSSVNDNDNHLSTSTDRSFTFQPVSERFTYSHLRMIKPNKATGVNMIPARLLKDSAAVTASSITHLLNLSLSSASFPNEWKSAKVSPIYKSGAKDDPDNYHPIVSCLLVLKFRKEPSVCSYNTIWMKIIYLPSFNLAFVRIIPRHSSQTKS